MNISEPTAQGEPPPLLRLAFRPGFALAALFAVFAALRWLAWLLNPAGWEAPLSPQWWQWE